MPSDDETLEALRLALDLARLARLILDAVRWGRRWRCKRKE